MTMAYRVMLCCNDERGDFTGRVDAIEIGDEVRIAGPDRAIAFLASDETIKIGRRRFRCSGRQVCVGNVFWDATSMSIETARSLLAYLLVDNGWAVEEHAEDGSFADLVGPEQQGAAS